MLDPYSEGIWLSQWEAFCWHGLGPLVRLEQMLTANQYKVSDHLYSVMEHLILEENGLLQDDSASAIVHRLSLNDLLRMEMMWIIIKTPNEGVLFLPYNQCLSK